MKTRLIVSQVTYLLPALWVLALERPQQWLTAAALSGLLPGLWKGFRRASRKRRRDRLERLELLGSGLTTSLQSVLMASTVALLGWPVLACWGLVALDQRSHQEAKLTPRLRQVSL